MREHPLIKPGLRGSGIDERVLIRILNSFRALFHMRELVANLAKLSVREGSKEAAQRLHRYLTADANGTTPGARDYGDSRFGLKELDSTCMLVHTWPRTSWPAAKFNLPDEPEPASETSLPDAAVLVRSVEYGPGIVPHVDYQDLPEVKAAYRFPEDYLVDLDNWFIDSNLLVDLLSIAMGVPLLSRTLYVRLAEWIEEMDPNFGAGTLVSGGYRSDVWPEGHNPSKDDIDSFLKLALGWHTKEDKTDALKLAIRRLAASVSRPGGRFGQEDRILDVAIALEIMYELDTPEITYKLKTRAGYFLGKNPEERMGIVAKVDHFYDARSAIAHGLRRKGPNISFEDALADGFGLARETLLKLLCEGIPPDWNLFVMSAGECRQVT